MRHKLITVLAAALVLTQQVRADDSLLFGGAEIGGHRSSYGQIGVLTALPGSQLGNGWVARGLVEGVTYKYNQTPSEIDGDALGVQATAGYQRSGEPGWWALYTGPVYRHTDLSPDDRTNDARGGDIGWIVQGEGERRLTKDFKINLGGNYMFSGNNAFWTRLRLLWRLDGDIYAGPEGTYQGDDEYRAWSLGAGVFGVALDKNTTLGLKAGVRKNEDFSLSPYGGIEIGYTF